MKRREEAGRLEAMRQAELSDRTYRAKVVSSKFRRADMALKRTIEHQVKGTGVYRSQHRLLMHLSNNPSCSQVALAEELEVSPSAIAVSIKKLEKGGFIRRETDVTDSRVHQVTITEKGKQVILNSIVMFQEVECRMFDGFSEEEMGLTENFLERIYQNLATFQGGEEK